MSSLSENSCLCTNLTLTNQENQKEINSNINDINISSNCSKIAEELSLTRLKYKFKKLLISLNE